MDQFVLTSVTDKDDFVVSELADSDRDHFVCIPCHLQGSFCLQSKSLTGMM